MTNDDCLNISIMILREDEKLTFRRIAEILQVRKSKVIYRYNKLKDNGKMYFPLD